MLCYIKEQSPKGIFITGDMTDTVFSYIETLEFFAQRLDIPIYFIQGNHENLLSSFERNNQDITNICKKYSNLFYMTNYSHLRLKNNVAVIGEMGWYSPGKLANVNFLKYSFDWLMVEDFKPLKNWKDRLNKFKELADDSAEKVANKLKNAFVKYDTVYLLTHFPGWPIHTNSITEIFWRPYNTNTPMGVMIEEIMKDYQDKKLIVLAGHSHSPSITQISHNIKSIVGKDAYKNLPESQILNI